MTFEDIDKIWKKNLQDIYGAELLKQKHYSEHCLNKLKATENLLNTLGINDINKIIYYNLVDSSITEPMYNLLLKNEDEWFNKNQTIPYPNRQKFIDSLANKTDFKTNMFIHHFQMMKGVEVRTFHEAAKKIKKEYQYEKLVFLRHVGAMLAYVILLVDIKKISLFLKIPGTLDNPQIHYQIDNLVGLILGQDTSLDNEIEDIRNGKSNINFWNDFNKKFNKLFDNKEIKINENLPIKKSSNFFRKLFMIDESEKN